MDDDSTSMSADDALEPVDETTQDFRNQSRLAEDGATPAAPATDNPGSGTLPKDHPITDSDIDEDELYSEGLEAATDMQPEFDDERIEGDVA